ncbi:S49 family peptidase [Marinobacter zhejiangensis]|uniref:Protease-4 n=1 Tax=Marinobacter zhejiangensis TaxID=488535 RepID=A0A1I4NVQ4_9GAMM|nr:S49 family peptidase [Marinobacter zhejiangensis]SFM19624.1 protease-4 [Marinobacter zhejiangensis]
MSEWDSEQKPGWGDSTAKATGDAGASGRDWKLIEKLILSMQDEQRKSRRWGIFFKVLTFVYLFVLLFALIFPSADVGKPGGDHTALVEITGTIAADEMASADNIVGGLREAFEAEAAKAVVLRINSPGGSPVQAGYVYDEILRLREQYPEKRVYAVIADIGASGAYYIAAAADEIYADKASLVGSIGVVGGGFGFTDLMEKVGVERRLYTSGENKAFLDPFSPEKEGEVEFWQQVLDTTHRQFIEQVQKGRGDRLANDDRLFSGLVWTGEQAVELGLVDALGSASYVAREVVGHEEFVDYTRSGSKFDEFIERFGASVGSGLANQVIHSRLELR